MFSVTGALSLENISEMAAVDENRRRVWFGQSWRPVRRLLPVTTAVAVTAIAGVLAVIALFEAGLASPVSMALFLGLIAIASAASFVSIRTSLLITALLGFSALGAGYAHAIFNTPLPSLSARLVALTLCAVSLGHLTVSWRDAGDNWRNARDIAENALSDGLRRFLFLTGVGAASLFVSAKTFGWAEGVGAAQYCLMTAFISVLLAPPFMIAMSAQFRRY